MANQAQGAIDFLKSRGFSPTSGERFPLFDTRKKLYESMGLNIQLGDFRGEANQNTALLNKLMSSEKNVGVSITPQNVFDIVRTGSQTNRGGTAVPIGQTADVSAQQAGLSGVPTGGVAGAPTFTPTVPEKPVVPTPEKPVTTETPTEATDAAGLIKNYSPSELLNLAGEKFGTSAEFLLEQEGTQAEKAGLQLKAQADKETFIKNLASRGLIFSGKKTTGVSAIEAETLAKQLGVDRKYALFVAKGLETAAQDIAKEAQKGNEMAIKSLEALGYGINPITGKIEPTLAAKKAGEQEEQFAQREKRLEESQAASEERFRTSQEGIEKRFTESQEAIQKRFEETQKRLKDDETDFTKAEKSAIVFDDIKVRSGKTLMGIANTSSDGFTNTDEYLKFRKEVSEKIPSYLDDFDKAYAPLLRPSEAARIGIVQGDIDPFEAAKRRALQ